MSTADDLFAAGLEHHRAGRLDDAAESYRQALELHSDHADALHLAGVVALQLGDAVAAVASIEQAVAISPGNAAFHVNLSEALRAEGRNHEAVVQGREALRLDPQSAEAANSLGLALQVFGQPDAALDCFGRAVALRPDFAEAFNNLGLAFVALKRPDDALAAFERAVELRPEMAAARSNLGQALLECHQPHRALEHCECAVQLEPASVEALNNLGNALRRLGRLDDAKRCYLRVLQMNPQAAMAQNNMGQALQEAGLFDEAIGWYERALKTRESFGSAADRNEQSVRFLCNLASTINEQERHDEAAEIYCRALAVDPDCPTALNGLGFVHQERDEFAEAVQYYRRAVELDPALVAAHVNLGRVLAHAGCSEEACSSFHKALERDGCAAGAFVGLADAFGAELPDDIDEAACRLLATGPLSQADRIGLGFALADVRDKQDRFAEAARLAGEANGVRRERLAATGKTYDPEAHARFIDGLIENFNEEFFARTAGWGLSGARPVFHVGLPRSGKSLTEQMLAGHPHVYGAGELKLVSAMFRSFPSMLEIDREPIDVVDRWTRDAVERAARDLWEQMQSLCPQAEWIVDTLPGNYLYLGLIAALFPNARIVHCRRDLQDTALACWMTNFKQQAWAADAGHIASRIQDYRRVMEHWRSVLPAEMLELEYEQTVADPEATAHRLLDWLKLAWDPRCVQIEQRDEGSQLRRREITDAVDSRYVGRWKSYRDQIPELFAALDRTVGAASNEGASTRIGGVTIGFERQTAATAPQPFFRLKPGGVDPRTRTGQIWALYRQLDRSQWQPAEEIERLQLAQVRVLLEHCVQHVPYYRDGMKAAGIAPADVQTMDDFRRLPTFDRRIYQDRTEEFIARQLPSGETASKPKCTSGTSGRPSWFRVTDRTGLLWQAFNLRELEWCGLDPRGRLAAVRKLRPPGEDAEPGLAGRELPYWSGVLDPLIESGPSYAMDVHQDPRRVLEWLQEIDPDYLLSYAGCLHRLAGLIDEGAVRLPRLRAIQSISEELPEVVRVYLQTSFGVPVHNCYSCEEAGHLASPCPAGHGLHVHAENVLLEVVDKTGKPAQPGEPGRILMTSLHNSANPFVRYEIGDEAAFGGLCSCGRGLPLLVTVSGKARPLLVLADGRGKTPTDMVVSVREVIGIQQYQIVQRSAGSVELSIVASSAWTPHSEAEVRRIAAEFFEGPVDLQLRLVDCIELTAGGKLRDVVVVEDQR